MDSQGSRDDKVVPELALSNPPPLTQLITVSPETVSQQTSQKHVEEVEMPRRQQLLQIETACGRS